MCVQRFDDSQCSAIHITFRASLRSSSMQEPRDPLLKVLFVMVISDRQAIGMEATPLGTPKHILLPQIWRVEGPRGPFNNDPSAGSPTETLLRLLLPLNDQV
jgi:hypothetical protein